MSRDDGSGPILTSLTSSERKALEPVIREYHIHGTAGPGQCTSLLAQRMQAPASIVWSVVRRFDKPQIYKHFIRSCTVQGDPEVIGCLREVCVISGLPASTSTERLDILDDSRYITGFTIIGGEHRLRNYRQVLTVTEIAEEGKIWSVVLKSYIVDVPEGNTGDDTRMFADTVVKLNLQKLASVTEEMAKRNKEETH